MITKNEYKKAVTATLAELRKAKIRITDAEKSRIEVVDFGLGALSEIGLQILTYINTKKVCAKELIMFPYQICPQHRHVTSLGREAKEETFRCRKGTVYLYVEGEPETNKKGRISALLKTNVFKEIILRPGDQYTILPGSWHWFQAGGIGAIVSEFSTASSDDTDEFFDQDIIRETKVSE